MTDAVEIQSIEALETSLGYGLRDDVLTRQHEGVGVVNLDEVRKEESLGVMKVNSKDGFGVDGGGEARIRLSQSSVWRKW